MQGGKIKNRKLNRWTEYDYTNDGVYFITICTKDRVKYFGWIKNSEMVLNDYGRVAEKCWIDIPKHFPNIIIDEFVVMPNHIHGILMIDNETVGNNYYCSRSNGINKNKTGNKNICSLPWQTKWSGSLSSVIRGFKIGVTKWCRENGLNDFQWQKSYYDHVIRHSQSLNQIRKYIYYNPVRWNEDRNNIENLLI